ncbi:MAG: hypothetical protein K2Q97_15775 [Burkholderiaceae bacterium]|nr:hypothetical protein [Burkholderiaceae bacterium]
MLLHQKSAFNGFCYQFLADDRVTVLGEFNYAWLSQAKNARLRFHSPEDAAKGDIQLTILGQAWRVRHLYLRRGFNNDLRYTLETEDGTVHAQIDVLTGAPSVRQPQVLLTHPMQAELGTSASWLRKHFVLLEQPTQRPVGTIQELGLITTRRDLQIDLPGLAPAVGAFLGIVALIVRF